MKASLRLRVEREQGWLSRSRGQLSALSPFAVLNRGYSVTTLADGSVVRDVNQVAVGQSVDVRISNGIFGTKIETIEKDKK